MTVRNLTSIFNPSSVALIGASARSGSVGAVIAENLRAGSFQGRIMLVNPKRREIDGQPCFPSVAALPEVPDLAVICTPPQTVPRLVGELGERGTKGVVVITAGFGESDGNTEHTLRQSMLDAANPHLLRIVGPNCVGIMVPGIGLNASFADGAAKPGKLALVSQSGAILAGIVDWAGARDIGFSHLVSIGDMADVDFGDMLDYLAADAGTSAILLYMEAVTHARKFMTAARAASRVKPVIVMKSGRHAEGAKAAASHTGALAGADDVFDAAFRRAGLLRVTDLQDLFDAAEILSASPKITGERLAILTNGGGFGVLATDSLIDAEGRLAELSPETVDRLDKVLPATWSRGNPIDIIGDAPGERYQKALEILMEDRDVDAILVMNCPTAVASSVQAAEAVLRTTGDKPAKPVITSWIGDSETANAARKLLEAGGLPVYDTPNKAVEGFMQLVRYRRGQTSLMETPPSIPEDFAPDAEAARAVMTSALAAGRHMLTEPEAKVVLAAYGIPTVRTRIAADAASVAAMAEEIGCPVAVKILSHDITHKSDKGGVALDLESPSAAQGAAEAMLSRINAAFPGARIEGFTVQQMVRRPGAQELILGVFEDPQFGPVILFGHGGTGVEVIDDKSLALPPLNMRLARRLMARTRVHRLLEGYRDQPAADLDTIAHTLIKVAQLAIDHAEVAELDINPLIADENGVIALDARIKVSEATGPAESRLAIRPYPQELREVVNLADGRSLLLRAIRPEDEPVLVQTFQNLSAETVRLRFFAPLKHMTHQMAARLTQIDYDREMALVLADRGIAGKANIYGVVRITADPNHESAEYAVVLADEMMGMGLGRLLMQRIIDYARSRGLTELCGRVLRENEAMLGLCRELGFRVKADLDDPGVMSVNLAL